MRFALGLEYHGAPFCGWQTQKLGNSVQEAVETALSVIAGHPITVVCAGRTDAGVHALQQVVHFDTHAKRPNEAWVRGVNSHLPPQVAILWAQPVADDFHARFSARGRSYRYLLINRQSRLGLWHQKAGFSHHLLDAKKMQAGADFFLGEQDFSAFRASDCQAKTPIKTLRTAEVTRTDDLITFDFEATAFLHHMVRNMVGSLIYVGQGKHPPEWIAHLLTQKNRNHAAPTFSPDGLYLAGVSYEAHWGLPLLSKALIHV